MVMYTRCNLREKFSSRIVTISAAEAVSTVKSPAILFKLFSGAYKRMQPSWLQEPWKQTKET